MRFTRDMADAFGDWLERERIHQALVAARPALGGILELDEDRPLLRIPRAGGTDVLVAKTADEPRAGWIVGIPDPHSPTLHETSSLGDLVRRVLEVLDARHLREDSTSLPE